MYTHARAIDNKHKCHVVDHKVFSIPFYLTRKENLDGVEQIHTKLDKTPFKIQGYYFNIFFILK